MNLKSRIKRISEAIRKQAEENDSQPFLSLEQWKRHADGEDITAEIPVSRRAEFDEWERKADERVSEIERRMLSRQ